MRFIEVLSESERRELIPVDGIAYVQDASEGWPICNVFWVVDGVTFSGAYRESVDAIKAKIQAMEDPAGLALAPQQQPEPSTHVPPVRFVGEWVERYAEVCGVESGPTDVEDVLRLLVGLGFNTSLGPWTLEKDYAIVKGADGYDVAEVHGFTVGEGRANARFIVAAHMAIGAINETLGELRRWREKSREESPAIPHNLESAKQMASAALNWLAKNAPHDVPPYILKWLGEAQDEERKACAKVAERFCNAVIRDAILSRGEEAVNAKDGQGEDSKGDAGAWLGPMSGANAQKPVKARYWPAKAKP